MDRRTNVQHSPMFFELSIAGLLHVKTSDHKVALFALFLFSLCFECSVHADAIYVLLMIVLSSGYRRRA